MEKTDLECEVLIVGGGPAGLSVAAALPDDVDCILVHQDQEIGLPVRTSGGSWTRDMKRLGIPPELYHVLEINEAYSDNAHVRLDLKENKPVILEITALYKWLAAKSDHKKRRLMLATKFTGTEKRRGGHVSTLRRRDGTEITVRSRFIVDASGWHMAVLTALGLREKPERRAVGIEYVYPIGKNRPHRGILIVGSQVPSGYGWGFTTASGQFHFGIGVIQPDTDVSPRKVIEEVLKNDPESRYDIDLSGPYTVNGGILPSEAYDPRMIFGNVIRTGDSANFATPTAGEGIRICIELGESLGRALGKTLRGGGRWHLWLYALECRRKLQLNYFFGYLLNTRGARFTPEMWDASVARMGRLDDEALAMFLRGEFRLRKMALMTYHSLRARAWNLRDRLKARLAGR